MKTIIIDNKIQLIENSTRINVTVICPKHNVQKMLDETGARFVSKKEIELSYNHRAGVVYEVVINVLFHKVEKFLKVVDIHEAENVKSYIDIISVNRLGGFGFGYSISHCYKNEITSLYAFGDCSNYSFPSVNTHYFPAKGKMILLNNNSRTDFGKKRYVQNNGKWYSNRKF